MTPRLTRMDSAAIQSHLQGRLAEGLTLAAALQELLNMDLGSLLDSTGLTPQALPLNTVMDIVRVAAGPAYSANLDSLAQSLHRRVIDSLGDIHIPHFFITHTIPAFGLTPAQAWLITVARDMAFVNARTGERRERVTFRGGYREMAELAGSNRYKTVQAWLHPQWTTQQRGGDLARFLQEVDVPDSGLDLDLRVDSMPRVFRVLLDEPLDADGSHTTDADGTHMADAPGIHIRTRVEGIAGAGGSRMADADGTGFNSFKHPVNTNRKNTSAPQHAVQVAEAAPPFWELEALLQQNEVHPRVQRELLEAQASVHALVSWVLYAASPRSGNLSDPLGYALSRLREHPLREARGIFRQLADLPPAELLELIDATPKQGYALPLSLNHPLAPAWNKVMGAGNLRLPIVRAILFGEGACEPS
ncbi:MAG: hypothetical protein HYZ25_15565 [Chloroflexi bacterium]|nr:hypothetical protein [Chloroflexota bacterium]